MCQLLGLNSRTPTDATFSFKGFSQRGGGTDHHGDGWGIAFFEGKAVRHFVDAESAVTSPVAALLQSYRIKSLNIIAHVRKATQGNITLENAHPFVREMFGHNWVFAHNGDLKGYKPELTGRFTPVGDTDSEHAFCWLLQEILARHATMPSVDELSDTLSELVKIPSEFGTFNFMLSTGQALWAFCTTNLTYLVRQPPFHKATLRDQDVSVDFAELNCNKDRTAVIVTQPLTTDEAWVTFKPYELIVFESGAPQHLGLFPPAVIPVIAACDSDSAN